MVNMRKGLATGLLVGGLGIVATPVVAQSGNPILDFWLGPFANRDGAQTQQQTQQQSGAQAAATQQRGFVTGRQTQQNLRYRAPKQNVGDAQWDDPFDASGARTGVLDTQDEFAQPVDMANTVPILSNETAEAIKLAMARYQSIVERGGWQPIDGGEELKVGSQGPRVIQLRNRLIITGDLRQTAGRPTVFDSFVHQAVVRFQRRHGLRPTGRIDQRTLSALNVPARARLSQLSINLGRISEQIRGLPKRFAMVNIPGQEIEGVRNGVVETRHRAIVGKLDRPTPLLNSRIHQLNFFPYWHVPESIVRRDLVPILREDPEYLVRTNLRVFRDWGYRDEVDANGIDWNSPEAVNYKFRQEPGDGNALGYVRINFHNKHQVFLHDTPSRSLFGQEVRADSSGCVRIQNIEDFVTWTLDGQNGWNSGKVQEVIQTGSSRNVDLQRQVPLYMIYVTAWANDDGMVHFRRDLYARDGVGQLAANY